MILKTAALNAGIAAAIGTAGLFVPTTSSAIVPDGHYRMVINDTPFSGIKPIVGSDGNWNSSFSFGCLPGAKSCTSQGMYDKDISLAGRGSSIEGDGVSGLLDITVSGNSFSINTFNKDVIRFTAGGDFQQYLDTQLPVPPSSPVGTSLMKGTINWPVMTLDPTGRFGAVPNGNDPAFYLLDRLWSVDDCDRDAVSSLCVGGPNGNTAWEILTTGTVSNTKGSITGRPLENAGDISGSAPAGLGFSADGKDDFNVILVQGGSVGSSWAGFFGAQEFEAWNLTIYSLIQANDDTGTTNAGVTVTVDLFGNDSSPFPPRTIDSMDAMSANGGAVTDNGNGTADYTPPAGFTGTDTFTYTIADADPGADPANPVTYTRTATVTVTVNVAGSPNAVDDSGVANQNGRAAIDVTNNDTPAGTIDKTTVNVSSPASNGGTVVDAVTGIVTYSPNTDFAGTDTFRYTVDNSGGFTSNEATVTVTVNPIVISSAGTVSPGSIAIASGSTSGQVSAADVMSPDTGVSRQCVGGCYDFVVSGLAPGAQVNVFLPPLVTAVTATSAESENFYRKLQNGAWMEFDPANVFSGARNAFGTCSSNAGDYSAGMTAGDECLMLTLTDGSLAGGDADGAADGSISDPGGIGVVTTEAAGGRAPSRNNFNNTGCSISTEPVSVSDKADWWLVAGFLALLGWMKRYRSLLS